MLLHPWDFPGTSTGVGCHCLLQEIFPTQGSNPGLPHCRQMLYRLSHQGSLEVGCKWLNFFFFSPCPLLLELALILFLAYKMAGLEAEV